MADTRDQLSAPPACFCAATNIRASTPSPSAIHPAASWFKATAMVSQAARPVSWSSASTSSHAPKAKNRADAPTAMARSGRRRPSWRPTTMARPSAATMPSVEPSHTPNQPCWVASVIVASMVLSPNSARKNAAEAARIAERFDFSAFSCSPSLSESPHSVQAPKPTNATAAINAIQPVGSVAPSP